MQDFRRWCQERYAVWPGYLGEQIQETFARLAEAVADYTDEAVREMREQARVQPPLFNAGTLKDVETIRSPGPKGIIYAGDALVRRDGVEMLTEVPEGWEVKLVQLPHTPPLAVAAHPDHPPRLALLERLPLSFEDWLVLGHRVDGENDAL